MRSDVVDLAEYRRKRQARESARSTALELDAITLRSNSAREEYIARNDAAIDALIIRDDAARRARGYDVTTRPK